MIKFIKLFSHFRSHLWVSISNKSGSVEHYYHFVLGYLLPLCGIIDKIERSTAIRCALLRKCGPMDRILAEFDFKKVKIIENAEHISSKPLLFRKHRILHVSGFDQGRLFEDRKSLARIKECVQIATLRIKRNPCFEQEKLSALKDLAGSNLIVLGRANPEKFYTTQSEVKGSGASRRSIQNFDEIVASLESSGHKPVAIFLEKRSLAYQISLFENADIIIAQHGAALVNLIWCKENTKVVEIVPRQIVKRKMFQKICSGFNLRYARIVQNGYHSEVDPADVVRQIHRFEQKP